MYKVRKLRIYHLRNIGAERPTFFYEEESVTSVRFQELLRV